MVDVWTFAWLGFWFYYSVYCSSRFDTVFMSESEAGVLCFLDSVSFLIMFWLCLYCRLKFLFFCTAACPSGWRSCCCGCCTLHLEDGLVADGDVACDDDGVGMPVGAAELYSAEQLFPLITLAGLMSLQDFVACLGFAIQVVVNVCKFRLHFSPQLQLFLPQWHPSRWLAWCLAQTLWGLFCSTFLFCLP